jgi:hypothetical protein
VQEFHRWLAKASVHLHGEGYEAVAIGLHSCVGGLLLLDAEGRRGASRVDGAGKDLDGEGVDDGDVGDGDATRERHDDAASGFDADGGAVGTDAGAVGESREAAESGFKG